jgi:hypothetical protein
MIRMHQFSQYSNNSRWKLSKRFFMILNYRKIILISIKNKILRLLIRDLLLIRFSLKTKAKDSLLPVILYNSLRHIDPMLTVLKLVHKTHKSPWSIRQISISRETKVNRVHLSLMQLLIKTQSLMYRIDPRKLYNLITKEHSLTIQTQQAIRILHSVLTKTGKVQIVISKNLSEVQITKRLNRTLSMDLLILSVCLLQT